MAGRPSKLTPELQEKLCGFLRQGWFFRHACAECEVDEDTVNGWLADAKSADADPDKVAFSVACARARAEGERFHLDAMHTMAVVKLDYKSRTWVLERLNPKAFHLTNKTELSGPDGGAIQVSGPTIMVPPESDD